MDAVAGAIQTRLINGGKEKVTIDQAKEIRVGDIVILETHQGLYEITEIDRSKIVDGKICFRAGNISFEHKEVMTAFRENKH